MKSIFAGGPLAELAGFDKLSQQAQSADLLFTEAA
jgi:hypothetical protein